MLTTRAVGVDDDVGEGFSGDEECRGHRSIIAGFPGSGEQGGEVSLARAARCGGGALQGCGAVVAVGRLTLSDLAGANGDNGPMHDAPDPTSAAPERNEPPAPRPQPKSAYQLPTKKNTVLRNMVWALALTMAVVVVIGIGFFGVGSDLQREPLENSALDVAASAERAQRTAPFTVAVPEVGNGWTERSARFTDGDSPRWIIQYSDPQEKLVTLTQESEVSAPMLSSALPGSTVVEELTIGGAECSLLSGGPQDAPQQGISCEGADFGLLIHGEAERAELEQLAGAALISIG